MTFDEMYIALHQAKNTLDVAASVADKLADLLEPHIDRVSPWRRARLKKRLRRYHARSGEEL